MLKNKCVYTMQVNKKYIEKEGKNESPILYRWFYFTK